jgi:hypothetical protein
VILTLSLFACAVPTINVNDDNGGSGGSGGTQQDPVVPATLSDLVGLWTRVEDRRGQEVMHRLTVWSTGDYFWQIYDEDLLDDEGGGSWVLEDNVLTADETRCPVNGLYDVELDGEDVDIHVWDDNCSGRTLALNGSWSPVRY